MTKKPTGKDRSSGWKAAKVGGHMNEEELAERLRNDEQFARLTGVRIFGEDIGLPKQVLCGGSAAPRIEDIFGRKSNGKPDITVLWSRKRANLSIKMSDSGQVFLTSVDRFIAGFEFHFGKPVPKKVVETLHLFIGTDPRKCDLVMRGKEYQGPMHKSGELQEQHQHRLLGATLERYFDGDWTKTLGWLNENSGKIADFVFARGYAQESKDFATHVWYFNADNGKDEIDSLVSIKEIVKNSESKGVGVVVGKKNGGSTIQFPFGFLQMHTPKGENQMQFHHNYKKISQIVSWCR
jgi:hypothetical protein